MPNAARLSPTRAAAPAISTLSTSELTQQAAAAAPEGRANDELRSSRDATAEQQVRDVRTGGQQQHASGHYERRVRPPRPGPVRLGQVADSQVPALGARGAFESGIENQPQLALDFPSALRPGRVRAIALISPASAVKSPMGTNR